MKRTILIMGLVLVYFFAFSQEIELEKIVITPYRYSREIEKTASSVEVISEEDIKNSNAQNILELLKHVCGLVKRDWFGNATKGSLDIRGFGELGQMNVLVLIDGRRINEIDLSGVDWTQIPLNQIEKIEIIRSGSTAVLYGDNAVSGVVNIVTKKAKGTPRWEIDLEGASYNRNKQVISFGGKQAKLGYIINAHHEDTNGYRRNSFYKTEDFSAKFSYDLSNGFSIYFNQGFHNAKYGLPGALRESDLKKMSRKDTRFPDDYAKDKDYYFVMGAENDLQDYGEFSLDTSFRRKEVYTNFIGANQGYNPFYKSRIDTLGFTPKYILNKEILGFENKIILGVDIYKSDYMVDNYDLSNSLQNTTDINKLSLGYYLQDEFALLKNLFIIGGYRYESAKYDFNYHDNSGGSPDVDTSTKPNIKAFNLGLVYNYKDNSSLFFSFNRSFRFPAVDEYFSWGVLNLDLKPQTSKNYEFGIRHSFAENFKTGISFFMMNVKNELYYNPAGGPFGWGANENYDKTCHQGLELDFDFKILEKVSLFGSYGYTKATFKDGPYNKKTIPMVPRNKGNIGLKISLFKNVKLNILSTYVGERYFINDQENNLSRLNGYFTVDTNLIYTYKNLSLTFGVNNLFNKEYSEYGVYGGFPVKQKAYYPSPERNFYARIKYVF